MRQEEKELLIKDLSSRLPYGVMCKINNRCVKVEEINPFERVITYDGWLSCGIDEDEDIKPYLRPMSSMTEEEKEELGQEQIKDEQLFADCIKNHPEMRGKVIPHFAAEWCNKNHFNYRLPEHLFITVTETNNPYKA